MRTGGGFHTRCQILESLDTRMIDAQSQTFRPDLNHLPIFAGLMGACENSSLASHEA